MSNEFLYQNNSIGVRGLTLKELEGNYPTWFLDQEVCKYNSHSAFPKTVDDCRNYILSLSGHKNQIVWAVYHLQDKVHIGNISLQAINWINRSAEIAFIFGEKKYWGKGLAFDAANILLNHGFDVLNLNRIYCGTATTNVGMKKLAQKLGMSHEGTQRESLHLQGVYVDAELFGLLKNEFSQRD